KFHIFPEIWNKANIIPIPKPNKDHRYAENYRPIAISSCFGKLYERILSKRLQVYCINHGIFDNNQCGFQLNRSTQDMLSIFLTDAYKSLDMHTDMDCIFTDFSKAYDTIWHKGLLWKLNDIGIDGHFLFSIKDFLCTRQTRVEIVGGKSEWHHQTIGVPQGSPLSPLLYIIYTNSFKIKTKGVKMGLFADDTIFWTSPGIREPSRYAALQHTLDNFYDWCCKWKLKLNPTKCNALKIGKVLEKKIRYEIKNNNNNNSESDTDLSSSETSINELEELNYELFGSDSESEDDLLYDEEKDIEIKNNNSINNKSENNSMQYYQPYKRDYNINGISVKYKRYIKYLGLWIDDDLNFQYHINKVIAKIQKSYYYVCKLIKSGLKLTPKSIIAIYKTKARSIIEYGAEFYLHYDTAKHIEKWQNKFMKLASPGKSSIPIDLREKLQDCENLSERVDKLLGRTWLRAMFSDNFHPLKTLQQEFNDYLINHNNTKFLQPNPNQYQQLNNYLHHNYNSDNNNNSNTNNPTHTTNTLTNTNMIINQNLASQCSKSTNKYFISKNKLTYTPKSVLYRAKQIITDLKENNVFNIISNPIRQPISAL
ncbi:MAG: reverse transcriptase family protein, partial [Chloroflexi bacterium]|nr:reverse transcriptase family protein [Chloroflexota bacterium]